MLLAQISDPHLDGSAWASERAERVMGYLRGMGHPVDALLVTGDIADHAHVDEYAEAAKVFTGPFPVLFGMGNHDARAPFRRSLLGLSPDEGPVNELHRVGDVAVLMCDSTIPGQHDGRLDNETLDWIRTTLDDLGDTPSLLAMHHPPVSVHHPLPDSVTLRDPDDLALIVEAYPRVVAVLVGHAHMAAASTFAGRPLLLAPAVTSALRLPWEDDQPSDRTQPPGIAFHFLDGQRNLFTRFRVVL